MDKWADGSSAVVTFKLAITAKKALDGKNSMWNDHKIEIGPAPPAAKKNGISFSLTVNLVMHLKNIAKSIFNSESSFLLQSTKHKQLFGSGTTISNPKRGRGGRVEKTYR